MACLSGVVGGDGVMFGHDRRCGLGFPRKEATLYMWRTEIIRMVLTRDTIPPHFLFSSLFVSFPSSYLQLCALTSVSQLSVMVTDLPLSLAIIYWSGAVDYLLFVFLLIFFQCLSAFVLLLFLFMM